MHQFNTRQLSQTNVSSRTMKPTSVRGALLDLYLKGLTIERITKSQTRYISWDVKSENSDFFYIINKLFS